MKRKFVGRMWGGGGSKTYVQNVITKTTRLNGITPQNIVIFILAALRTSKSNIIHDLKQNEFNATDRQTDTARVRKGIVRNGAQQKRVEM
jgi:hypothetical protein